MLTTPSFCEKTPELEYLKLGASLYVPAIHPEIINIAIGKKYPELKSVIIDTEDSITQEELPFAYHNIERLLSSLDHGNNRSTLIFIRVRNPEEFKKLSRLAGINNIDGFVLPKFSVSNMEKYMDVDISNQYYMPILEKDVFDIRNIEKIRDFLLPFQHKILSIRVGATDLLSSLGLRRDNQSTIYEIGIINKVITEIVLSFKPYNFNIVAPVWECFSSKSIDILKKEVRLDLMNGLFGKTIIHPYQIKIVQDIYKVDKEDHEIASKLLDEYSPAVFKLYDRMHEKATHSNWAKTIIERAKIYGLNPTECERNHFE